MKYAIGTAAIIVFAAGAYCTFRVLRFKQLLDAFAADIGGDASRTPRADVSTVNERDVN